MLFAYFLLIGMVVEIFCCIKLLCEFKKEIYACKALLLFLNVLALEGEMALRAMIYLLSSLSQKSNTIKPKFMLYAKIPSNHKIHFRGSSDWNGI